MDDLQRLINFAGDIAAKAFGKELPSHQIEAFDEIIDSQDLYCSLELLIKKEELGRAEDLLFETAERLRSENVKMVGAEFYSQLSALSDKELARLDFPRSEIEKGKKDFEKLFIK